jgi:hypothetical protein
MLADDGTFTAKQFRNLGLTEPDGVSLEAHIDRDLAIGGLKQDDLIERLLLQRGFCGEGH